MNMRSSLKIEGKRAFFSRVGLDLLTDLRESETGLEGRSEAERE
jgi:hypothetical protein